MEYSIASPAIDCDSRGCSEPSLTFQVEEIDGTVLSEMIVWNIWTEIPGLKPMEYIEDRLS